HHHHGFRLDLVRGQEEGAQPEGLGHGDPDADRDLVPTGRPAGVGGAAIDQHLDVDVAGGETDVLDDVGGIALGGGGADAGRDGLAAGAAGRVAQGLLDLDAPAHLEHADDEEDDDRRDQGELDDSGPPAGLGG